MDELVLARGFVVSNPREIIKSGLAISNPRWHPLTESNWPPGLSFARSEKENYSGVEEIAHEYIATSHDKIPCVGVITLTPDMFPKFRGLIGIKRVFSEGSFPLESIEWQIANNWDMALNAYEYTILPQYLTPKWLDKLRCEIGFPGPTGEFIYEPFSEFRTELEGQPFWTKFLKS